MMLGASRAPRICQVCRVHLLNILHHGFTQPITIACAQSPSRVTARHPRLPSSNDFFRRTFLTNTSQRAEISQNATPAEYQTPAEIEAVVRRARKTFGDNLPKDYLSREEYHLYERLYGPPIRETRGDDLEDILGPGLDIDGNEQVRNVIIRQNADGDMEEIEYDSSLGYKVTRDSQNGAHVQENYSDTGEIGEHTTLYDSLRKTDESEASEVPVDLQTADTSDQATGDAPETFEEGISSEDQALKQRKDLETAIVHNFDEGGMNSPHVSAMMQKEAAQSDLAYRETGTYFDDELALAEAEAEAQHILEEEQDGEGAWGEVQAEIRPKRECDVLKRLQKEWNAEIAARPPLPEEQEDEDIVDEYGRLAQQSMEDEGDEESLLDTYDGGVSRLHPHTVTARSTRPKTMDLPKAFLTPIEEILAPVNNKHLKSFAENILGGPKLPFSPSTPSLGKQLPQTPIPLDPSKRKMSDTDANVYLAGVMPPTYAAVMHTLIEIRKRLGTKWLRGLLQQRDNAGPSVLDAGGGGAGACAWRDMVQAEWDTMREEMLVADAVAPSGEMTVLASPDALRHKASRFLENTTFLPRLPDYVHTVNNEDFIHGISKQARKSFDIIIAPHTLWPLQEGYRRKQMVRNLWTMLNPYGGILLLLEKGLPRGFEAIAGARDLLLEHYIPSLQTSNTNDVELNIAKEDEVGGMIIAPCTNHAGCPMFTVPGLSSGRKDYCHFNQRYHRPQFLQRIMGAAASNHEDVKFSYIAVRKGLDDRKEQPALLQGEPATLSALAGYEDSDLPTIARDSANADTASGVKFNALSLPRIIYAPLKRHGHVTLDLCTPSGTLERWTVPKSFSKVAYHDARKGRWGDLWALGAKTRVPRTPRLGRKTDQMQDKIFARAKKKGKRGQGVMGPKNRSKPKVNKINMLMGEKGFEGFEHAPNQAKYLGRPEKRTKGGRNLKPRGPLTEEDID